MNLEKEIQIVTHLSNGLTAKAIASEFRLSPRTIELYIDRLKLKYDAVSSTNLVAIFFRKQLIK